MSDKNNLHEVTIRFTTPVFWAVIVTVIMVAIPTEWYVAAISWLFGL